MIRFPFYNFTILSELQIEEIESELKKSTINDPDLFDFLEFKYVGSIENGKFQLYRGLLSNTYYVKIIGDYFYRENNKSKINIKIIIAETPLTIFILTCLIMIPLLFITIIYADSFWLKISPLYFLSAAIVIIVGPYLLLSKHCEKDLIQKLSASKK